MNKEFQELEDTNNETSIEQKTVYKDSSSKVDSYNESLSIKNQVEDLIEREYKHKRRLRITFNIFVIAFILIANIILFLLMTDKIDSSRVYDKALVVYIVGTFTGTFSMLGVYLKYLYSPSKELLEYYKMKTD